MKCWLLLFWEFNNSKYILFPKIIFFVLGYPSKLYCWNQGGKKYMPMGFQSYKLLLHLVSKVHFPMQNLLNFIRMLTFQFLFTSLIVGQYTRCVSRKMYDISFVFSLILLLALLLHN